MMITFTFERRNEVDFKNGLQSWLRERRSSSAYRYQGVPGGGKFATPEEVVSACVALIFRCSVQHSAYGSPQYDEYGFSPNYPGMLTGAPPTDRVSTKTNVDKLIIFSSCKSKTVSPLVLYVPIVSL